MTADTPGKRVYLIRLALGDGLRSPMPMAEFAALLTDQGGARYDSSTISKIENEMRKVALEEAPIFAAVDPLRRGREWLAWGAETTEPAKTGGLKDVRAGAVALTAEEKASAEERADAIAAGRAASSAAPRAPRRGTKDR